MLGICEQERITRVRGAGFNSSGLPDEALDELLTRCGRNRAEIAAYVLAEAVSVEPPATCLHLDHHFAHACSAFLPSPFDSATIVVCDHEAPQISVWDGHDRTVTRIEWPWHGAGFAEIYSGCADALGFSGGGHEQRMEALARLHPERHDDRVASLFAFKGERLELATNWQSHIESLTDGGPMPDGTATLASGLQCRIGNLLVEFLAEVRRRAPARRQLCLGGSLFYNSYFNTRAKRCGAFDDVFVPINPGNAGLAVGNALHAMEPLRESVTPFLGPSHNAEEIKASLDNCKLHYQWASEADAVSFAVEALLKGRLVGWFSGAMEFGQRALGARSILANPFAPYALDNLNRFLKQREPWRGYALSVAETSAHEYFDGPGTSPFMECDYVPKDPGTFRHVLPSPKAAMRVHTVGHQAPPMFQQLLSEFGKASGMPILVNTSFNGFREPIVCSPRDAIRVFFGTGLDVLVLGHFIVSK
jgi:carbamoyltransferase